MIRKNYRKYFGFYLLIVVIWIILILLLTILLQTSLPFTVSILASIFLVSFPLSFIFGLRYFLIKQDRLEFGWNLRSRIETQVPVFQDLSNLKNEIKAKVSELRSLQQYKFKSFIIEIQKKRLKKELKILRKQYINMNRDNFL
jgi:hypothetical protein